MGAWHPKGPKEKHYVTRLVVGEQSAWARWFSGILAIWAIRSDLAMLYTNLIVAIVYANCMLKIHGSVKG